MFSAIVFYEVLRAYSLLEDEYYQQYSHIVQTCIFNFVHCSVLFIIIARRAATTHKYISPQRLRYVLTNTRQC